MAHIHPTAIVDKSARLHETAVIGAFCIVGENVEIGEGTVLRSHIVVGKNTKIGKHNEIYQFASLGETPQDKKFQGEESYLEIGDNNKIRESCTLHRGTADGGGLTKIGNDNLLMVNTHIAHDCIIGNGNVFANNVGVAGHAVIGDFVTIGGQSGVHQFCQIGSYAMIGASSLIVKDVCAFITADGRPAKAVGLNKTGLKRRNFTSEQLAILDEAYRIMFRSGLLSKDALTALEPLMEKEPLVRLMWQSLNNAGRGLTR